MRDEKRLKIRKFSVFDFPKIGIVILKFWKIELTEFSIFKKDLKKGQKNDREISNAILPQPVQHRQMAQPNRPRRPNNPLQPRTPPPPRPPRNQP